MKAKTKDLLRKIEPYWNDYNVRVRNKDIISKEIHRRLDWKHDVLYACDNRRDYFPPGTLLPKNWFSDKVIKFPNRKRVPKQVFLMLNQTMFYHIIQLRQGKWKIVRKRD